MISMETATYLGPARVLRVDDSALTVSLGGRPHPAKSALAFPYRAVVGDTLLVLRLDGEELYAIGVLDGRGETAFESKGTITLRAPRVRIEAGKLEITAERILEKARDVYRWVSEFLHVKSRHMRTAVEKDYQLRAGTATVRAVEDVHIDGRSINLG